VVGGARVRGDAYDEVRDSAMSALDTAGSLAAAAFVSDVHLSIDRPRTAETFLRFLAETGTHARRLFILGDLFEYWAGDDDVDEPLNRRTLDALRTLGRQGVEIAVLVGNRDFLLGSDFERATGVTLLDDPWHLELDGQPFLLSHGDALCTDDRDYQDFRRMTRARAWRDAFLAKPLATRKTIIADLRMQSRAATQSKSEEIMDVNDDAVAALFVATAETRLIHGHTHRPARHALTVAGRPVERWVLPDWDLDTEPPRGGGLILEEGTLRRIDWNWQR